MNEHRFSSKYNADLLTQLVEHPRFLERESEYIRWYPKSLTPHFDLGQLVARPCGIYVHVPFCDQLCKFCPFNKQMTRQSEVGLFIEALLSEIDIYCALSAPSTIDFVYFGGGSPSALGPKNLDIILSRIQTKFALSPHAEITIESHPSHIDRAFASSLRDLGATRVSSGIQSFKDATLARMGAMHSAEQGYRAIEAAGTVFGGVAIDLLFRCPGQSVGEWQSELSEALSLPEINHLSLYSLILKDAGGQPSALVEAEMTLLAHDMVGAAGMRHYASCASGGFDFAKPGSECIYESRHWGAPQAEFIGLGPGALGYLGGATTVNGLGLREYIADLKTGTLPLVSVTKAGNEEAMRRYFVLGVKTLSVDFEEFKREFGVDSTAIFRTEFERLERDNFARVEHGNLVLTPLGRLFVDSVSAAFFSELESTVVHPEEPEIRRAEIESRRARRGSLEAMVQQSESRS